MRMMKFLFPLLLVFSSISNAAVTANTIWNIDKATGASTNGGCFDATIANAGTNMSLGSATAYSSGSCSGAGNTMTISNASSTWIGNCVSSNSGTNVTTAAGSSKFQITNVSGTTVTFATNVAGTSICTGVSSDAAGNVGGSLDFYNSATDDTLIENSVAGNIWYIKQNSNPYTPGAITLSVPGTDTAPIKFLGYASSQGDNTPNSYSYTRITPSGAYAAPVGQTITSYLYFENGSAITLANAQNVIFRYNKVINSAAAIAVNIGGNGTVANNIISTPRGTGLSLTNITDIYENVFFDCLTGLSGNLFINVRDNLFFNTLSPISCNASQCVNFAGEINHNTFIGVSATGLVGTAINYTHTLIGHGNIFNNIIYGYATGISVGATSSFLNEDYNNIVATTPRTNISNTAGHDFTTTPTFNGLTQRTVSSCTTTSGNHLVCSGATFQTWGVTAGQSFYLASGTGTTNNTFYTVATVDSQTQVTTTQSLTANATADKVSYWNWVTDLTPTSTNIVGTGGIVTWASTATTSYPDVGAVHTNKSLWYTDVGAANVLTSVGSYKYGSSSNNRTPTYVDVGSASNVKTGINYGVGLTGTYTGSDRWTCPSSGSLLSSVSLKCDSTSTNLTGTYVDVGAQTNVKHDVSYGVGLTGSYRGSDLWTAVSASDLKHGVIATQDGSVTGTYRGYDLFDILGVSHVESGFSYLSDGSTLTGTHSGGSAAISNTLSNTTGSSRTTRATGIVR